MFNLFQKRNYKISYRNKSGEAEVMRTQRRSIAKRIVKERKAEGCTEIVLWERPRHSFDTAIY